MRRGFVSSVLVAVITVLTLVAAGGALPARADSGARTYTYLIATAFLCALPAPLPACPAIASADNGDTVEIAGSGTFTIHSKSASGGGGFVHKDPGGTPLASGTWSATELLSFQGYGTSTPDFPPTFEGGKVLMRVTLTPSTGPFVGSSFGAVLQVDCLIGKTPAGAAEGVRLNIQGALNFNREVSGLTLYIRLD